MKCATCDDRKCVTGRNCSNLRPHMVELYQNDENASAMLKAAEAASGGRPATRVEQTLSFIKHMGYKKVGLAFCVSVADEAKSLHQLLVDAGLTVSSVCCKLCGIEKHEVGTAPETPGRKRITCNPVGQARTLNRDKTELNIMLGLCVGHDAMFTQESEAPVTTLVAKDHVLGHNPAAALYTTYYKRKLQRKKS
ncbi:DUF1847 domain-containing protein [Pseudodesulfovibrio senegalensis]|uniref:DUF1847 domain-containing protein n=1 Tax=Pseudodesulfovibrio senegalensis TaxID=1721087 RepID=A0A6N6N5T3_9BACT|nr:DUF1847 domain-containing protein [Pseudodesulfovibrio senegalensis]KAB1442246.1 DUF1847 domain-containing protein [Pseudodesulfovibrio senegalensis]